MPTHFLTLEGLSPERFRDLLAVAAYLKRRRKSGMPEHALAGRKLAMVFEKPSLRTRMSFELAMVELGGYATYIRGEEVGLGKREAIQDVARVLGRYVDGIMARVFKHETVQGLAQWSGVPVINGLCDRHHPCQALGDLLTLQEAFGRIDGLTVVFVGDGNNVARSLAQACVLAGSRFILACPEAYAFPAEDRAAFGAAWGSSVIEMRDPRAAAKGADVLYSDVWTSMGQEAESAKRLKDFQGYAIDDALIAASGGKAKILHCLPAHRGEEISDSAMEHANSLVFPQAENRLHAQKAVLRLLLARDAADAQAVVEAARDVR